MADPVTLLIASTAISAVSSISQGQQQASAYKAQANVDTQNANNTTMAYAAKIDQQRRQQAQALGSARAASAENGTLGTGSSLDVEVEDTTNAKADNLALQYEGDVQRTNYLNSARANRASASNARKAGYIGALSSVLSGGQRYGEMNKINWLPPGQTFPRG